jgi:hypothetical protein
MGVDDIALQRDCSMLPVNAMSSSLVHSLVRAVESMKLKSQAHEWMRFRSFAKDALYFICTSGSEFA